jgi:hypothetical protein
MNEHAVAGTMDGVEDDAQGMSQIARVVNVFVAPTATFRDILRSTSWWLPFVLMTVAALGVTAVVQQKVGWEQVVETQIRMTPSMQSQMNGLEPAAQGQRIHLIAEIYQYSAFATPLIVLGFTALAALVFWVTFNFGLGARATYGQFFCLWMYCSLPRLLSSLVTVISLYFGSSPETFNLKEPVGTNLAYYLPDAPAWLRTFLGFGDVIGIWVLVLLIVGGAIVAKVRVSQAAAVVVGWWLLIIIVSVAATAAMS